MPTPIRMRLRNHVATSPLLRKGGVHERSKSGIRANVKLEMQDEITDWREALEEERLTANTHPRKDSGDDTFFWHLHFSVISLVAIFLGHSFLSPSFSNQH